MRIKFAKMSLQSVYDIYSSIGHELLYSCLGLVNSEFEEKALLTYRIMATLVDQ